MYSLKNNILTIKEGAIIPQGEFRINTDIHRVIFEGKAEIGNFAFEFCTDIKQLIIPEGVIIHVGAFGGCNGIEKLTILKGSRIGGRAFGRCTGLTTLTIPEQGYIGSYAFEDCTNIKELSIGRNTYIEGWAFKGCTGINTLSMKQGVTLGSGVFFECVGITYINIPENGKFIIDSFKGCTGIIKITMPALFEDFKPLSRYFRGSGAQKRKAEFIRLPLVFSLPNFNSFKGKQSISGDPFKRHFTSFMALCFERLGVSTLPKLPIEMWWSILNQVYNTCLNERKTTFNKTLVTKADKKSIEQYRVVSQLFHSYALNSKKIQHEEFEQERENEEKFLKLHLPESARFMCG